MRQSPGEAIRVLKPSVSNPCPLSPRGEEREGAMWGVGDRRRGRKRKRIPSSRRILTFILEFCTYTCHKSSNPGEKSPSFTLGKRRKKETEAGKGGKDRRKKGRREGKQVCFSNWLHYMFHPSSLDATRVVLNFYKPRTRKWELDMSRSLFAFSVRL